MTYPGTPAERLSVMERSRRRAFVDRLYQIELMEAMRNGCVSNLEAQAVARNRVSEIVAKARELEKEFLDA